MEMQDQEAKLIYGKEAIKLMSAERIDNDDDIRIMNQQDLEISESERIDDDKYWIWKSLNRIDP